MCVHRQTERTRTIRLTRATFIAALAFTLVALHDAALAQVAGTAQVTATIVTPISAAATTELKFGNVMQGVPKTVSRTAVAADTSAAVFTVSGHAGAGISIQLTLPQYMSNLNGDRMTISFGATDCTIDSLPGTPDAPGAGAWVGVNPYNLPTVNVGSGGSTAVYLGGKVTPAVQQEPGDYSADIIISVTYDGT